MSTKTQNQTFSTIIEIRPGNGGKDAQNFTRELSENIKVALIKQGNHAVMTLDALSSTAYEIKTNKKVNDLLWLSGTHVVTRIPSGSAARHTSSALVVVRSFVTSPCNVEIKDSDIRIDRYRGHGAGGQRKNKVSTAVRLVHLPTGIILTRETGRSQLENLESAKEELKAKLQQLSLDKTKTIIESQREKVSSSARDFTHDGRLGKVTCHSSGKTWALKQWNAGKFLA